MPEEAVKPEEQAAPAGQPVVQTVDDTVQQPLVNSVQIDPIVEPAKEDVQPEAVTESVERQEEAGKTVAIDPPTQPSIEGTKVEPIETSDENQRPPETTIPSSTPPDGGDYPAVDSNTDHNGTGGAGMNSVGLPDSQSHSSESVPVTNVQDTVEEQVRVVEKPLTQEDREKIYREELTKHLPEMNAKKHEQYEKHLQEIVDFIHEKHTLVSNQDIEEGLKIPDSTVTARLNELIKRGIVTRIGDDHHAKYRLTAGV